MRCSLLRNLGIDTPCQHGECVYWGFPDEPPHRAQACRLEHYGLVGTAADATAKWLYEYKLSAERTRVMAHIHAVQSGRQHITRSTAASVGVA